MELLDPERLPGRIELHEIRSRKGARMAEKIVFVMKGDEGIAVPFIICGDFPSKSSLRLDPFPSRRLCQAGQGCEEECGVEVPHGDGG
jgi:hypothetical protein